MGLVVWCQSGFGRTRPAVRFGGALLCSVSDAEWLVVRHPCGPPPGPLGPLGHLPLCHSAAPSGPAAGTWLGLRHVFWLPVEGFPA